LYDAGHDLCYIADRGSIPFVENSSRHPMRETWLRTNRRILGLGMIFPTVGLAVGLWLLWLKSPVWQIGLTVIGFSAVAIALLAWQMTVPRLAGDEGELLIYLRPGRPIRLPAEFAECFFLSSGAGKLATPHGDVPVRNLVMRVAERAVEYQERTVTPVLGSWSQGYITFHGAWCEPLNLELVTNLNAKLSGTRDARQPAGPVQN
jgi:hypothetical protein